MTLYADRVQETTTTTGQGTLTLTGAVAGFRTFAAAFAVGDLISYAMSDGTDWEVGCGKLASSTTLSRDTIYASSNGGAAVNWGAGTRNVWCDLAAQAVADLALTIAAKSMFIPQ